MNRKSPKAKKKKPALKRRATPAVAAGPQHLVQFNWRKDFNRDQSAPKSKPVDKRPYYNWTYKRDQWEISFLMDSEGMNQVARNVIFPKIPDILQVIPLVIMGKQFLLGCALQFDPLSISIDKKDQSKLVFQLPIVKGSISTPGYPTDYTADYAGAKIIFELPIDRVSIEIRWENRSKAHVILDVEKGVEIAYRIEGAPKNDLLTPLIARSNDVLNAIINAIPLDGRVLGEFTIPEGALTFMDYFQDALPTRVYLSLVKCTSNNTSIDALAVRVLCAGKYPSSAAEPVFQSQENMVFRASSGLLMQGTVLPLLHNVFVNFQASLPANEFVLDSPLGVKTQKEIKFDKPSQLITRPLIKDNKELVEALKEAAKYESYFDINLGFGFALRDKLFDLSLMVDVPVHGLLQKLKLTFTAQVTYSLTFNRKDDGIYITAAPTSIKLAGQLADDTGWLGILMRVVLGAIIFAVSALVVSLLGFFLGALFGLLVDLGIVLKVLPTIKDISKVRAIFQYTQDHPTDIDGIIAQINAAGFTEKPLTRDLITFTQKLPAQITLANISRIAANQSLDVYGQFVPVPAPPRPKPKPFQGLVNVYQFNQAGYKGNHFYSTDPEPPHVLSPDASYGKYANTGMVFSAFNEPVPGSIPIYRYRLIHEGAPRGPRSHVNSFSATVEDLKKEFTGTTPYNISPDGIAFYVPASAVPSTTKGFLYRDPSNFGSVLLSNKEITSPGWTPIQMKFFVFPSL
ncbi:MAG: hypothetical protein HZC38_18210 [Chloroflexi bacterium]|nr:hypothetical protein [Chloroflexota bacterium]